MTDYTTSPEHIFLRAKDVFARYGWGRTKGYQVLSSDDFPSAIAGAYRLDTLIAWEELRLRGQQATATATTGPKATTPERSTAVVAADIDRITELPVRRRTRGMQKQEND